jgi:hypothetical protein
MGNTPIKAVDASPKFILFSPAFPTDANITGGTMLPMTLTERL